MRIGYRTTTARTLSLVFSLAFSSVPLAIAGAVRHAKRKRGNQDLIGSVNDRTPWDHLDYAGKRLTPVQGTIDGGPPGQISVM